jgi:hypothetical protein
VLFEGIRTALTSDIGSGESEEIMAQLQAPAQPGQYALVWDMVQEDVSWFSLKSSLYTKLPIQVTALPDGQTITPAQAQGGCNATTATTSPVDSGPVLPPPQLPKVLIQPNRTQLWQAAIQMLLARPLLGVGPNTFRMNYGNFSQPRLSDWDKRIFANSLPLEILADLGGLGGFLFLAFFTASAWSLLKLVWFGRGSTNLWQLALVGAIAAFLGHGLLDYILGSNAIFFLFWILFGLASTHPEQVVS